MRYTPKQFIQCVRLYIAAGLFALYFQANSNGEPNALGINISEPRDWSGNHLFADAMKTAQEWYKPNQWGQTSGLAAVDAKGWPTEDAGKDIYALTEDSSGNRWVGTTSNGIIKFGPKTK